MASAIERFLYGEAADLVSADGQVGDYFVAEMCLSEISVSLRIASQRRPYAFKWVRFSEAGLHSFGQSAAESDDLFLPWDIVGFYCREEAKGFWHFTLTSWHSRWSWDSRWPTVEDLSPGAATE